MTRCECSCHGARLGIERPEARWFCQTCLIALAEECGCRDAHPIEKETKGHIVVRKEE